MSSGPPSPTPPYFWQGRKIGLGEKLGAGMELFESLRVPSCGFGIGVAAPWSEAGALNPPLSPKNTVILIPQ